MRMVSDRGRPRRSQLYEAPTEEIETEGDRQLKLLAEKQLDKTADKRYQTILKMFIVILGQ